MSLIDVFTHLDFKLTSTSEELRIKTAIAKLYATNDQDIVDLFDGIANDGKVLTFQNSQGTDDGFSSIIGGYRVYYDFNLIGKLYYIDNKGNAVKFTDERAILHEIIHAVEATSDITVSNYATPGADYVGATVQETNNLMDALGSVPRLSYTGAGFFEDISDDRVFGSKSSLTQGQEIDLAIIDNPKYNYGGDGLGIDISDRAGSALIAGLNGSDFILSGSGLDYLYGGDGSDVIFGGGGADHIIGNDAADYMVGGSGDPNDLSLSIAHAEWNDNVTDIFYGGEGTDGIFVYTDKCVEGPIETQQYSTITGEIDLVDASDGSFVVHCQVVSDGVLANFDLTSQMVQSALGSFEGSPVPVGSIIFDYPDEPFEGTVYGTIAAGNFVFYAEVLRGGVNAVLVGLTNWNHASVGTEGADVINGTNGNENIDAKGGDDNISTGNGANLVDAGAGNDQVSGGDGDDTVYAGDGSDFVAGGDGSDRIYSGSGDDTVIDGEGDDFVYGEGGDDWFGASAGDDLYDGGADSDVVAYGGNFNDFEITRNLDNSVTVRSATTGVDTLVDVEFVRIYETGSPSYTSYDLSTLVPVVPVVEGTAGDDTLEGTSGRDILNGRDGDDVLFGAEGDDALNGGAGDDVLFAGDGMNIIDGGADTDTVIIDGSMTSYSIELLENNVIRVVGAGVNDTIQNAEWIVFDAPDGEEDTTIEVAQFIEENSSHVVEGTAGDDTLYGTDGSDVVHGYDGADTIYTYGQNDNIYGGLGDDLIFTETGTNFVDGGAGEDTLIIQGAADDYDISLYDGNVVNVTSADTNDIIQNVEWIIFDAPEGQADVSIDVAEFIEENSYHTIEGTADDDTLTGTSGYDTINGYDGADTIFGLGQDDMINGGAGDDVIFPDEGSNTVDGGDGVDTVIINGARSAFTVTVLEDDSVQVQGQDVNDTITNVEWIVFDAPDGEEDVSIDVAQLIAESNSSSSASTSTLSVIASSVETADATSNAADTSPTVSPSTNVVQFRELEQLGLDTSDGQAGGHLFAVIGDHATPGMSSSDQNFSNVVDFSEFMNEHSDVDGNMWFEPEPVGAFV